MNDYDEPEIDLEKYLENMVAETATFISSHFHNVNGFIPYGYHKICRDKVRPFIEELMTPESANETSDS